MKRNAVMRTSPTRLCRAAPIKRPPRIRLRRSAGGAPWGERRRRFGGGMSVRVAQDLASLQAVHRPAIRALAFAGAGDVDEDARMAAPQRHLGVGTEDHAVALHVLGRDF